MDFRSEAPDSPDSPERRILRELLDGKPIGRYEFFLTQREGRRLPGGLEEVSGFILTEHDLAYSFWLNWDAQRQRYFLHPFDQIGYPDAYFADDPEYQQARRRLGLRPPRTM